jgi:hypothetical protein
MCCITEGESRVRVARLLYRASCVLKIRGSHSRDDVRVLSPDVSEERTAAMFWVEKNPSKQRLSTCCSLRLALSPEDGVRLLFRNVAELSEPTA